MVVVAGVGIVLDKAVVVVAVVVVVIVTVVVVVVVVVATNLSVYMKNQDNLHAGYEVHDKKRSDFRISEDYIISPRSKNLWLLHKKLLIWQKASFYDRSEPNH